MKTITWAESEKLIESAHQFSIANSDCEGIPLVHVDADDYSYCITWNDGQNDFIILVDESENKSIQIVPDEGKMILIDNEGDPVELILYTRQIMKL